MDSPSEQAPQLEVETENVRKNSSVSDPDSKLSFSRSEHSIENNLSKPGTLPRLSADYGDGKNESTMKRVDSDSKFGHMENVPLELSVQEIVSTETEAETTVEAETNEFSLEPQSNAKDGILQDNTIQNTNQSDDFPVNDLSRYFTQSLSEKALLDTQGIEFFDALASSEAIYKDIGNSTNGNQPITANNNVASKDTLVPEYESEATQLEEPSMLNKFFAEDKSGGDKDGKAFFDKIAEVKHQGSLAAELQQPILTASRSASFFTSPVLAREVEETWIPSERTQQTLMAIVTSPPGTYTPDKDQLTMPGIIIDDDMEDPVKALLVEAHSPEAQKRKALTASSVTQDEEGLQKLIEGGCYHASINLTKHLLKACGQGSGDEGQPTVHTPLSLRLWYTRIALLVKLRKFSLAEVESAAFGDLDRPDLYYEFYPSTYNGKRGTMVPFCFRLLLAELPQYQGNHQIALDNLYRLLNIIHRMIKNLEDGHAEDGSMVEISESRRKASSHLWHQRERRVLYSVLNCIISQKDYILAISLLKKLIEMDKENLPQLYSALGRTYLQLGDVKCAQDCFTEAAMLYNAKGDGPKDTVEDNINKALLAIAHNNNEEAYKYYQQAYSICPENPMLANNMAVCLLYMGKLKESLTLIEKTIRANPSASLHDGILFNICTLYELESSRCTQKKLGMLDLVSKHVGDGFNITCLKIQSASKG